MLLCTAESYFHVLDNVGIFVLAGSQPSRAYAASADQRLMGSGVYVSSVFKDFAVFGHPVASLIHWWRSVP